jgi:predicted DsbA family dithiol-disulfide isomerase
MNVLVDLIEFTDPVCTWCWGSEPILRKLETYYGGAIASRKPLEENATPERQEAHKRFTRMFHQKANELRGETIRLGNELNDLAQSEYDRIIDELQGKG